MAEMFDNIKLTDIIRDSLQKLLNRDLTALTLSAGVEFPTDVNDDMIGRLVNRTDLNAIYRLKSANPVQWEVVLDYSSPIPNGAEIAAAYQSKHSNLTALSNLSGSANQVPYFTGPTSMSSFTITSFGQSVLACSNAEALRTLYGLGALAVKDTVDTDDIDDNSITEEKLAFTPIKESEGFLTGDIKETLSVEAETDWIECSGTIGDGESGADYANTNARSLFVTLWTNQNLEVLPSKGSSATADWQAHKKITLPDTGNYSAFYGTTVRIKL